MGRKIDIEFNDKTYTIEYDRASVIELMASQGTGDRGNLNTAVDYIYYGLLKHHEKDMPTKKEVAGWLFLMDNAEEFVKVIGEGIQEVLTALEQEKKQGNFKWGVRK